MSEPPLAGEPYLLTPGPLTTSASVKRAMRRDWGSGDGDFRAMTAELRRRHVLGDRLQFLAQDLHLVLDDLGGPVAVTAEQPGRADAEGAGNHQQLVGAGLGTVVFPALPGRRLHTEPAGRLRDRESGRFTRPPNAAEIGRAHV